MADTISTMLVTDVPFWQGSTGAQARITQLASHLNREPFDLQAVITQAISDRPETHESIPLLGLDLSQPPSQQLLPWLRWQCRAIAHSWRWRPRNHQATFNNYYPQAIVDHFVDRVLREPPRVLVLEYATQIQLLRSLPRSVRSQMVTVLDTHDILWQRARQFAEQGERHWIDVTQTEEEAAVREFDLILAISEPEAEYFRDIVGPERVIVTGMEFAPLDRLESGAEPVTSACPPPPAGDSGRIRIGHLASYNWANLDTVRQMLACWPGLVARQGNVELILAGGICEADEVAGAAGELAGCRIIGPVGVTADFYRQIDLVWNPVRFGTGLKIKNLEALAWAKCLVTSPHGAAGLELPAAAKRAENEAAGVVVLRQAAEFERFLESQTRETIGELGRRGQQHLQLHFGPGTQYPRLRSRLQSLISQRKS